MIGEHYLKTRERLAEVIKATRRLAERSRTAINEGEIDLDEQLSRPIRIVGCGESGAGKTTFLEKVCQRELRTNELDSNEVTIFRDTVYRVRDEAEDACKKVHRLRFGDLEVVDSSGLSKLNAEQIEALEHLIRGADFTFLLLPAENPWAAATWDMLERIHHYAEGKCALVLQQTDRRLAEDIPVLCNHLRELSNQRIGYALPIISAAAIQGGGISEAQQMLNQAIVRSAERKNLLHSIYQSADKLLRRCEDKIDQRSRNLAGDQEYLQSVEAQIDRLREGEVLQVREKITDIVGVMDSQIQPVLRVAKRRTGMLMSVLSLFGKGDGAVKVEKVLLDRVTNEASLYAAREAERMGDQCRDTWGRMQPQLEKRLAVEVGEFNETAFAHQQEMFTEGMAKATRHGLLLLKLRRFLDQMMMKRYRRMRRLLRASLLLWIVAGMLGCYSADPLSWPALSIAALGVIVFLAMLVYGVRTRRMMVQAFGEALYDAVPGLLSQVKEGYIDRVRAFYNGFTPMFESMRRHVAEAQADVLPQQQRASELFLALRTVGQEV